MTNYVFGKFYKTKCGEKVVCTNIITEYFRNDRDKQYFESQIESEWQDEKADLHDLMAGIIYQWRDEMLKTISVLDNHKEKPKRKVTYYCYQDGRNLLWTTEADLHAQISAYKRIPSLDKIVEVDE